MRRIDVDKMRWQIHLRQLAAHAPDRQGAIIEAAVAAVGVRDAMSRAYR